MTDAELSKAVADACGIAVTADDGYPAWWTDDGTFWRPTECWDDAIHAAEKVGLFDKHDATIDKNRATGRWVVSFYPDATTKHVDGVNNESGPRAICEAILAIKGGMT